MAYDSDIPTNTLDDPEVDDPSIRSLYTGDISTSILQKFAAWYRHNKFHTDFLSAPAYFCVRTNNGQYRFYVGDITVDGVINSCDLVTYNTVTVQGYTQAYEWTVSSLSSGRVDLDGYSGYIYSSYPGYQPNPYMDQYLDNAYSAFTCACILFCTICFAVVRIIRRCFVRGSAQT